MSGVITEKGKALLKWQPNDKYRDEFERIFRKKDTEVESPEPEENSDK